ncbi:MAG TPA: DNA-binding transcriptional regulator [Gammaproteobacteria bacterium]|nr:DNA-binding transcriptional regulator [Gammaproteobacteria bacterium]
MPNKILDVVHNSVKSLHDAGIVNSTTMREFNELCLAAAEPLSKTAIKQIRLKEKVSQPIFAKYLNVHPSTVKQWESGEKRPSGPALRLLHVVEHHGLQVIA